MKGTYLGEFEEVVLLTVGILYDQAYGLAITKELARQTNRNVVLSAVHSALHRLEKKGFLHSRLDQATEERGGKRKRLFSLTAAGSKALQETTQLRNQLFVQIPPVALKGGLC